MNTQTKPSNTADRILGIAMILLAIAYGYGAQQFEEPFGMAETIGPEAFPSILSIILGVSAVLLLIKPNAGQRWPTPRIFFDLLAVLLGLVVFALILEPIGFILSATLFSSFISWRMGAKPIKSVLIGFAYSVGLYGLFNYGLNLALPSGILEGIL